MINFEGGAIPEEYQVEYVADRVDTTSTVFMGLTMGCARCHDHKFDPITQKDYYRFFAFFNTIPEKGLDGKKGNAAPDPRNADRRAGERSGVAAAGHRGARGRDSGEGDRSRCWPPGRRRGSLLCRPRQDGLLAHYDFEGNLADSSGHYEDGRSVKGKTTFIAGRPGQSAAFNGEAHVEFPGLPGGSFRDRVLDAQRRAGRDDGARRRARASRSALRTRIRSPISSAVRRSTWNSRDAAGTATRSCSARQWHHVALNFENGKPALAAGWQARWHERRGRRQCDSQQVRSRSAIRIAASRSRAMSAACASTSARSRRPTPKRSRCTSPSGYILSQEESKRSKEQKRALLRLLPDATTRPPICAAFTANSMP